MYSEDNENAGTQERNGDDVFSRPVRAGKRTYFFDVKATKGNDFYLTITESKRRVERDGRFVYDKHKIFLYKEDFDKFTEGLEEVVAFIKERCPIVERTYEDRPYESRSTEGISTESPKEEKAKDQFSDISFEEL